MARRKLTKEERAQRAAERAAKLAEDAAETARAARALDALQAARPLRPPPTRFDRAPAPTAAARALASDIRNGVVRPRRAWIGGAQ